LMKLWIKYENMIAKAKVNQKQNREELS